LLKKLNVAKLRNSREIPQKKLKVSESNEEIKEKNEQKKDNSKNSVDIKSVLTKLLIHLKSPNKYSKCLSMIKEFISHHIEIIPNNAMFNILLILICQLPSNAQKNDREIIADIYALIYNYSEQNSAYFSRAQEVYII